MLLTLNTNGKEVCRPRITLTSAGCRVPSQVVRLLDTQWYAVITHLTDTNMRSSMFDHVYFIIT